MAKKVNIPTKVITGVNTRWSYANVWDPKIERISDFHQLYFQ